MDSKTKNYQIKITKTAEVSYFEVLEYVSGYYNEDRTLEIAEELRAAPFVLSAFPYRGAIEERLENREKEFRYILYAEFKQQMQL